jgi:hypothetical protein
VFDVDFDEGNPFKLSSDETIFNRNEEEKIKRKAERSKNMHLHVWEKNRPKNYGKLRQINEECEPSDIQIEKKSEKSSNIAEAVSNALPHERP